MALAPTFCFGSERNRMSGINLRVFSHSSRMEGVIGGQDSLDAGTVGQAYDITAENGKLVVTFENGAKLTADKIRVGADKEPSSAMEPHNPPPGAEAPEADAEKANPDESDDVVNPGEKDPDRAGKHAGVNG